MNYSVKTPQQLAMVLQGCRKQAGLTQKQAAAKVGMLPKTISSFETDPDGRSIESLFKLMSALNLEMVLTPKDSSDAMSDGGEW